ncbi:MAG: hypothetical protein OCC45_08605 [Desulfotalea sp.]
MENLNNNYSVWQKIDLHIHTDLSKTTKNNDYKGLFSVDTLHEKLIEQDVRIFSLTDHNIINLPAYQEYYNNFNSEQDPLLLLGIELDIERNDKTYHSLLIFNCSNFEEVERLNERLENKFVEKKLSLNNRKLTVDEVIAVFPLDDFFFIPHAGNTKSIVDGYSGEIEEAQKMLILFQSPLEKVPEKVRQIYNDNFDKVLYEAFRNKEDYAYIEFSDNHNINKYPCKHKGDIGDHKFYYIKGSKNYETLRLAFIDPKSRIKSFEDYNKINESRNYIESIKFKCQNLITASELNFTPHLNVIIGGRSSGKSLLMDILSRSIEQLETDQKYDTIGKKLETEIKSKFDSSFKKSTSVTTSIIQINQGDIVNFFEKKQLEDLARKTDKLTQYNQVKENFRIEKSKLTNTISTLQNHYKDLTELQSPNNYILHNHTIEKYISSEYLFKIDLIKIKDQHLAKSDLSDCETLLNSLITNLDSLENNLILEFTDEEKTIINSFEILIKENQQLVELELKKRNRLDLFLAKVKDNILTANSTLSTEGQEKVQAQAFIDGKILASKNLFKKLFEIKQISKEIECCNISFKEDIILDSESKLCLEVTSQDKVDVLIIEGIKPPNDDNLYLNLLKLSNDEYSIKNHNNNKPDSLSKKITTQLKNIFDCFDNPNDFLEYKDGTNSKNNSPGYNSEKYLQVILNNPSSNIILIDQPEDNLGNKFISEQLVDLIRNLKFEKQLFLITHNPAIVVYGDAESIILAENDLNNITYTQIKIEDEVAQRNICNILDGGEYIFDNRSKKYNIQKLLNKGL